MDLAVIPTTNQRESMGIIGSNSDSNQLPLGINGNRWESMAEILEILEKPSRLECLEEAAGGPVLALSSLSRGHTTQVYEGAPRYAGIRVHTM